MVWAILGGVIVAYILGSTIGYVIGRGEGEDKVTRYYESKRR